jgi:exopolysaccharide biosynthesis WecB/TagA/CpsF family protein
MSDTPARCELLGVAVDRMHWDEAADRVTEALRDPTHKTVHYVNAHSLNLAHERPPYREVLNRASLVLNDGIGLTLAGRLKSCPFPTNLNGSDFTPVILERAAALGLRVALYGAEPGVAADAARRLSERASGLHIVATIDGFTQPEPRAVVEAIRRAEADVLLVALGNPGQELWIDEHGPATGVRLATGVGAFLDFTAERVPRAPAWMNRLGVEWLFRLYQEPGRMWRRYVIGNPRFLLRILREALTQRVQAQRT